MDETKCRISVMSMYIMKSIDMPHSWHMCIVQYAEYAPSLYCKIKEKEKPSRRKKNYKKKCENNLQIDFCRK